MLNSYKLAFSDYDKKIQLNIMDELTRQMGGNIINVKAYGFRRSNVDSRYEALYVNYDTILMGKALPMEVEIIATEDYPHEEPMAVVITPDIRDLKTEDGSRLHVYRNFDYRHICSHIQQWTDKSPLGRYFFNAVVPWSLNFVMYIITGGKWHPTYWNQA